MVIHTLDLPSLHRAAGAGDLDQLLVRLDAGDAIDGRATALPAADDAVYQALTPLMVAAGSARGTALRTR